MGSAVIVHGSRVQLTADNTILMCRDKDAMGVLYNFVVRVRCKIVTLVSANQENIIALTNFTLCERSSVTVGSCHTYM